MADEPAGGRSDEDCGGRRRHGRGLATDLAVLARDRRTIPPAFQLLVHPILGGQVGTGRGANLRGLAPAWIGCGDRDPSFADSRNFAFSLVESEVSCALCVVPGGFSDFDRVAPRSAISRSFFSAQCRAVAQALA